jgi:DNA-binding MarR family transcriptional regulator
MNKENIDLFGQFARITELLHRHQHWSHRRHGPAGDPHRGQGRVMALLKVQPEISQKDLSYLLDIRPQSLGELLAKLERGGFIERTPSETDRRGMDIKLTEAGKQAAERPAVGDDIFACLNANEQATLSDYLAKIIEELEQALAGRDEDTECDRHGHGRHGSRYHGHHPERFPGMDHRPPHFDGRFGHGEHRHGDYCGHHDEEGDFDRDRERCHGRGHHRDCEDETHHARPGDPAPGRCKPEWEEEKENS